MSFAQEVGVFQARTPQLGRAGAQPPLRSMLARRLAAGLLAVVGVVAALVVGQTPAVASTSTDLLGNTSIPRIPREGIPADSNCAAGSFAVGARVWVDEFPRITGVATWCADPTGAVSLSAVTGDETGTSGDSLCSGTDLAVGLRGSWGEVMNALGIRCAGADGTYDAAVVGRTDTLTTVADCPDGSALDGTTAWSNFYASLTDTNVYGVQGSCDVPFTVSVVLQPINADGSSIFKAGRTVPVKFTATDPAGASVADLSATLTQTQLTDDVEGTYVEAATNVAATTGFRYYSTAGQYIYNWSTKGLASGTYRLHITITNGPTISVDLSLK